MRKSILYLVLVTALGLAGCAAEGPNAMAGKVKPAPKPKVSCKTNTATGHIAKVFKKGSKVCNWTSVLNGVKGTDYFYKDVGANCGSADRIIGDVMLQGTWKITGAAMNTNFYGGKKGKGTWYKVKPMGKKGFDLTTGNGDYVMSMKCK